MGRTAALEGCHEVTQGQNSRAAFTILSVTFLFLLSLSLSLSLFLFLSLPFFFFSSEPPATRSVLSVEMIPVCCTCTLYNRLKPAVLSENLLGQLSIEQRSKLKTVVESWQRPNLAYCPGIKIGSLVRTTHACCTIQLTPYTVYLTHSQQYCSAQPLDKASRVPGVCARSQVSTGTATLFPVGFRSPWQTTCFAATVRTL